MDKLYYSMDKTKAAPLLFHGTSTFYLDVIKNNGFNTRNIFKEYGLKEMLLELEQACILNNILCESYSESEDTIEGVYYYNCNYIEKEWKNNKIASEINRILYNNIRHIEKYVKDYQYGSLYFTTSLVRVYTYARKIYTVNNEDVIRGSIGELFNEIMKVYILFRQFTGYIYSFHKPEHKELIDKVYDAEKNCVAEWIQPVVIAVKDIPWDDLRGETGDGSFWSSLVIPLKLLPNKNNLYGVYKVPKMKYIKVQASGRYAGNDIPPEKLDIFEFTNEEELKTKICEKYEIAVEK